MKTLNAADATLSQAFKDAHKKKGRIYRFKVLYKKRYWNGSAYAYEATWQTLQENQVVSIGSINWKLDVPFLNTFRASNVSLRLNNVRHQWLPDNDFNGVFRADATATIGYHPYLTQFQVQCGYELDDGTTEYVKVFTGLAIDYVYDSKEGHVEITVSGNERKLEAADASMVSDAFTDEATSPATGDGSNKAFVTTAQGVAYITTVKVNDVAMTQGTDYTVSGLGQSGVGATITFVAAPGNTLTVKATGRKWKANQLVETLVGLLCDQAGIQSADRTINPVLFPGGVAGLKTIDTEPQWEAAGASFTNVSSDAYSGSIVRKWFKIDDFTDNDYTASPAWSVKVDEGGTAISAATGEIVMTIPLADGDGTLRRKTISLPLTKSTGTWRFQAFSVANNNGAADGMLVYFLDADSHSSGRPTGNGYALRLAGEGLDLHFYKVAGGVLSSLGAYTPPAGSVPFEYAVSRAADGTWKVYCAANGLTPTLAGTFTDATYSSFNYFTLMLHAAYDSLNAVKNSSLRFDTFYVSEESENVSAVSTATAVYISQEFDLLAAPTAWGKLDRTETLNGGTIVYATSVSNSSGAGYDAYVDISADGQINSALKRYLKIRATITPASGSITSPKTDKLVANFQNTSIFLALATFTGKTCFSAVQRLAKLCDYEFGFGGSGKFFFRSKSVSGAAVLALTQSDGIQRVSQFRLGYDAIINSGQMKYGNYFNDYDSTDAAEASPTSVQTFGTRISYEDSSDILLANDVNLATAGARLKYENNYRAKKRAKLETRLIPHIDLSDILDLTALQHPLYVDSILGDPLRTNDGSDEDTPFGPNENVLMRNNNYKIVGLTFKVIEGQCDPVEVQEVLS